MRNAFFFVMLIAVMLLSGCAKSYVCYDGTVKRSASLCPVMPVPAITDYDAGRFMDNYGGAVAAAKSDMYTRVNLYAKDGDWFSTALFSNREQQSLKQVLFKIDGKTGDVQCVAGCEYLTFSPR